MIGIIICGYLLIGLGIQILYKFGRPGEVVEKQSKQSAEFMLDTYIPDEDVKYATWGILPTIVNVLLWPVNVCLAVYVIIKFIILIKKS